MKTRNLTTINTFFSTVSPFLLLLIPLVIAALVVCLGNNLDKELIHERIDIHASFITIPEGLNVRTFFFGM